MIFEKSTTTTLIYELDNSFRIEITNENNRPHWVISFIDYDDSVGAIGIFESERIAVDNADKFIELAIPAYDKKYAKYGEMPTITLENGELVMNIVNSYPHDIFIPS